MRQEFAGIETGSLEGAKEYLEKNAHFIFSDREARETYANALNLLRKDGQIDFEIMPWQDSLKTLIRFKFKNATKKSNTK